jgi:general secretion pathway protein G
MYSLDMYAYPSADAGLAALKTPPAGADATTYRPGGYVKRLRDDPWGNPYRYDVPGQRSGGAYDVYSAGPDGKPGTADDIGNWE